MTGGGSRREAVIVGGGPAGASAACLLARAGRPVLLIEREGEPRHKICGEFLSFEAQAYLADLGIDAGALGGSPITMLRLIHGRTAVETELPFPAVGLSRRTLDEALLREAAAAGADLVRGTPARSMETHGRLLRLDAGALGEISAEALFLATGKHDLRGVKRPATPGSADLIGFKTYFALAPGQEAALEGFIELHLWEGGYAGLQMVEGSMANLCLLVDRRRFEAMGRTWEALLASLCEECPHLAGRLDGGAPLLDKPLAIAQIPYGFVHRPGSADPESLFRLGDQVGVIPSFSGDGMSIALHSGRLAASTYLAQGPASRAYHDRIRRDIGGQIRFASVLHHAGRSPRTQAMLVRACRAWPGALRWIAAWTRVPDFALKRAGIAA